VLEQVLVRPDPPSSHAHSLQTHEATRRLLGGKDSEMADIPADAPRSEDGYYWWDGGQWQPVNDQSAAQQGAGQPGGQPLTDDLFANMLQAATSDVQEA
jgi:hypothetical protein